MREVVADDSPETRNEASFPSVLLEKVLDLAVAKGVVMMIDIYGDGLLLL